jgi:hypothetical protein
MKAVFDLDFLRIFLVFVLPGLVSIRVYRLIMPAEGINWSTALIEGIFYSSINYALLSPLVWFMHSGNFPSDHPISYGFFGIIVLFIGPIIWPLIVSLTVRKTDLVRSLQIPYPSAWDYYFDDRKPAFVLVHLKTGKLVGGYFGKGSYATSFPNQGEIYLEAVYETSDDGTFGEPIEDTDGLIIAKDEYHYIELFDVPDSTDEVNDNE